MRTFDDFTIGEELEFGEAAFELDEMIAFAERWDPQLFHTDSAAAAKTAFGGIIASGWQTLAASAVGSPTGSWRSSGRTSAAPE